MKLTGWTAPLAVMMGCESTWDTPLVVAPHDVSYILGDCGVDQGPTRVEEMVLTPTPPYDGSFELHYVRGGQTYELTDCTRGSFAGDTIYCERLMLEGEVEPPMQFVVGMSGWVEFDKVEYAFNQVLFCPEQDMDTCGAQVEADSQQCDMSLQGVAEIRGR
jgi:hypothetical protein